MRKIILLALFIVVVLVGCNESMVTEEQEIVHAQSVKIPYTEDYIHHVEENEYVISDRNGRVKKYCKSVDSAESITGEDSTSIGTESGIYTYDTSSSDGPVSKLVESGPFESNYNESGEQGDFEEYQSGMDEKGQSGNDLTYLGDWTTTAYCPCSICCGQWASGYTASGTLATSNYTVACGILPFGTQVMIDGVVYVVEDTGVSGEWIDIFFDTHEEALNYGMQVKAVYLVED